MSDDAYSYHRFFDGEENETTEIVKNYKDGLMSLFRS